VRIFIEQNNDKVGLDVKVSYNVEQAEQENTNTMLLMTLVTCLSSFVHTTTSSKSISDPLAFFQL
jgi:hypothetical protein